MKTPNSNSKTLYLLLGFLIVGSAYSQNPSTIDLSDLGAAEGEFFDNLHCGNIILLGNCTGLTAAGDINHDGIIDSLYSQSLSDSGGNGTNEGPVYILFGSQTDSPFISPNDFPELDGTNGFAISSLNEGDRISAMSFPGDINSDGIDDVILVSTRYDYILKDTGAIFVVFGTDQGFPADFDLSTLDGQNGFAVYGEFGGDRIGRVDSDGDFNGDTFNDLLISTWRSDYTATNVGAAYVILYDPINMPASIDLSDIQDGFGFAVYGVTENDKLGYSSSFIGDINDDGFDDISLGLADGLVILDLSPEIKTHGQDELTAAYVIYGSDTNLWPIFDLSEIDGTNGFTIKANSENEDDASVSRAGDFNHDGIDDFIINIFRSNINGTSTGSVYVIFGDKKGLNSEIDLSLFPSSKGMLVNGLTGRDFLGPTIKKANDVNNDNIDDLIIKSKILNPNGDSGTVYVIYGSEVYLPATFDLESLNGNNGYQIFGAESLDRIKPNHIYDVNSDGINDIIIWDNLGNTYVVYGFELEDVIFTNGFDSL